MIFQDTMHTQALRRALPGITANEIQNLKNDELTRQHLQMVHGEMLDSITSLLYRHDPENIVFDLREMEYNGEAAKILLQLPDCNSVSDFQNAIHKVMKQAFDNRVNPLENYAALANDVWHLWRGTR